MLSPAITQISPSWSGNSAEAGAGAASTAARASGTSRQGSRMVVLLMRRLLRRGDTNASTATEQRDTLPATISPLTLREQTMCIRGKTLLALFMLALAPLTAGADDKIAVTKDKGIVRIETDALQAEI